MNNQTIKHMKIENPGVGQPFLRPAKRRKKRKKNSGSSLTHTLSEEPAVMTAFPSAYSKS